jgi:hypothetical protein
VKSADCVVQNEGVPIEYRVEISAEMSDRIVAGWRPPSPQSTVGETRPPLPLLYPALGETTFEGDSLNALFPGDWRPEKIMGYGAHLEGDSMVVRPGGEIWIKPKGWVAELQGFVAAPAARDTAAPLPVVRACYYKNGRIDLQAQNPVRAGDGRAEFRLWSPEVDGWFVIALTGPAEASPVAIKFTQARRP